MRTAEDKRPYHTPKGSLILRACAGMYLLYLAYQLISGWPTAEGTEQIIGIIGIVFFAIAGAALLGFSVYALSKGRYQGGAMDSGQGEAEAGQSAEAEAGQNLTEPEQTEEKDTKEEER